jgi:hypothetical protein
MSTVEAKFEEVIEVAQAAGLHTIIRDNEVTVYLVSTKDFNEHKRGIRPSAIRAVIRTRGRKTIAYTYTGVRTQSITRTEALQTLTEAID